RSGSPKCYLAGSDVLVFKLTVVEVAVLILENPDIEFIAGKQVGELNSGKYAFAYNIEVTKSAFAADRKRIRIARCVIRPFVELSKCRRIEFHYDRSDRTDTLYDISGPIIVEPIAAKVKC